MGEARQGGAQRAHSRPSAAGESTVATLMLGRGVHAKLVSEMLGHANIVTTLDTYSHVLPTMSREGALVMEELLR
jgi:integrase